MTGCTEKAFEVLLDNKQYLWELTVHISLGKQRLIVHAADKDWVSLEGQFWLQDFFDSIEQEHTAALIFFFFDLRDIPNHSGVSTLTHTEKISAKVKNLLSSFVCY